MSKTDCKNKQVIQLSEAIDSGDVMITHINVPCGKCAACLTRRKQEWGFRMENELENSKTAYFVTLTYAPESVPYDKYGNKVLVKKDLQDYLKRLRQRQKRSDITIEHLHHKLGKEDKIKYYACGEYGEQRGRPHYHLILFNASRVHIESAWNTGEVHCVKANANTIAYVMKYLDKWRGKKQDWKKPKEFNVMSTGIGIRWVEDNADWFRNQIDILYVVNKRGIKCAMPRYYRNIIHDEIARKEQVLIVTEKLDNQRNERIHELGSVDAYNKEMAMKRRYQETVFNKKVKKRLAD